MPESVKIQVHEGEPGVAVVMFVVPPEQEEQRRSLLDKALKQWSEAHPHFEIGEVKPLRRHKKVFGLSVFFQRKKLQGKLTVKVAPELLQRYGSEYIEAIMMDAVGLLSEGRVNHDLVAMISRREIAILVEKWKELATIIPLEEMRTYLSEKNQEDLARWLEGGEFGYFVAPLQEYSPPTE